MHLQILHLAATPPIPPYPTWRGRYPYSAATLASLNLLYAHLHDDVAERGSAVGVFAVGDSARVAFQEGQAAIQEPCHGADGSLEGLLPSAGLDSVAQANEQLDPCLERLGCMKMQNEAVKLGGAVAA